ncbi:hypothetical protein CN906_30560 [Bacillus toyonensis]|nr:hypothetical protein CN906_30560 [Bacillus toyonensis]
MLRTFIPPKSIIFQLNPKIKCISCFIFVANTIYRFHFDNKLQVRVYAFWGTASVSEPPTLRICKILYNFSDNPVTNENPKTHTMIGMYKKLHRLIKRKKANLLLP